MSDNPTDLNKSLEIFSRCRAKTVKGQLKWRPRENRPDAFEVDLPSGNIEIGTEDDDGAIPHDFRIYSEGPDGYVRVFTISGREHPDYEVELEDLWAKVNRLVLGVEGTLDALLEELEEE